MNWRTSLWLERVGVELVADAPDGEDELGVGVIALDASPQPADVNVHGARLDVRLGAPYEVQQLEPIVHPIGVADEELEQLELAQREAEALPIDERLVGVEVEPQATPLEDLVRGRRVPAVRATEDGPHPRHQLARTAGPRNRYVGAGRSN